jgi:hypothetical protein
MQPQALPDAVTQHEAAVKYRHPGILPGEELSIDINPHRIVTGIFEGFVCTEVSLVRRCWHVVLFLGINDRILRQWGEAITTPELAYYVPRHS